MSLALRKMVMGVLTRPEIKKIDFKLGGITVSNSSFNLVAANLRSGKIDVDHDSKLGSKIAKYKIGGNKYVLGFKTGLTADNEALIVHESVHAAGDLSSTSIKVANDEAAAYVAQSLYFYYRNEELFKKGAKATFADRVLREAWKVATKARSKKTLSNKDIQSLISEISRDPKYIKTHATTRKYDGVT